MITSLKLLAERILCKSIVGVALSRTLGEWITSPSVPRGVEPVKVLAPRTKVSDATRASLFWGFHEAQEIRYVTSHLTGSLPVVELGTSLGVVSAHIARRLNGANKLVCVEANGSILALARETIFVNAPNTHVVTISGAIDYSGAPASSFTVSDDLISSRLAPPGKNAVAVPNITLSAVLAEANVGDYVLVCDVEGAESQILERDTKALDRCELMIIELHPGTHTSIDEMSARIQQRGFALVASHGAVSVFRRL